MDTASKNARAGIFHQFTSRRKIVPKMALYDRYVEFAIRETSRSIRIHPFPTQEKFKKILAADGKTTLKTQAFQSSKFRLLRSLTIDGGHSLQVLDFAVFPQYEFDLPIFCANFFSSANVNIIVLDLNPLYNVEENHQYKKKYYQQLMPLVNKYLQTLPWNDTITFESLKFFSPIVVWTKFHPNQKKEDVLWSAFMDYYLAWLNLMNEANPEDDANKILSNKEAQHKYLSWRATKDPGHSLLRKLVGDSYSKACLNNCSLSYSRINLILLHLNERANIYELFDQSKVVSI
eukprot:TRINITY_DN1621_c0_g1_i6.p1 TRINITY_DN1621_c0_g1~~TRINITY_DN1621_c0_g1_i6.p1  ORF type:complete len:290 (-),score=38.95 TRINITY_DN1621_c0_g1_i6:33-902(-)